MPEPRVPDLKMEGERERLGREYYKFYFLFGEVLANVDNIMSGADASDFKNISDDEKEHRAVLRHGIANWIMAPMIPAMSERFEKFVSPERSTELYYEAMELLKLVGNLNFTWKQRIEKSKDFILVCLDLLYPGHSPEQIRERFGGEKQEQEWIEKVKEEEREIKRQQSTSQSPRT